MGRLPFALALLGLLFASTAEYAVAQDAPDGKQPQRLPVAVMKSWEKAEKQVQRNRETYDKANEKVIAGLQRELEKMNPPVKAEEIIERFQKEAVAQLDAHAKPPAPPPPEKGVLVFNGHRYRLVEESLAWTDAKAKCEAMGGHLLTIEDRLEQEFISGKLSAYLKDNIMLPAEATVWLGIKKDEKTGSWHQANGEIQKFTSWDPRGLAPNYSYAMMHCRLGIWMGSSPDANPNTFFICEWDK